MANSKLKCTNCGDRFPAGDMQKTPAGNFHTFECLMEYANKGKAKAQKKLAAKAKADTQVKEKAARAKHKADKRRINNTARAEALLAAQLLGRLAHADDNGYCTCVSCGIVRKWNDNFDGGHFIAKGDSSYWALDPRNIFPQCSGCNGFKMQHGTALISYTAWMVDRFGQEFVDHMLEVKNTVTKRSHLFYEDYLVQAKKDIAAEKQRIGAK